MSADEKWAEGSGDTVLCQKPSDSKRKQFGAAIAPAYTCPSSKPARARNQGP